MVIKKCISNDYLLKGINMLEGLTFAEQMVT